VSSERHEEMGSGTDRVCLSDSAPSLAAAAEDTLLEAIYFPLRNVLGVAKLQPITKILIPDSLNLKFPEPELTIRPALSCPEKFPINFFSGKLSPRSIPVTCRMAEKIGVEIFSLECGIRLYNGSKEKSAAGVKEAEQHHPVRRQTTAANPRTNRWSALSSAPIPARRRARPCHTTIRRR